MEKKKKFASARDSAIRATQCQREISSTHIPKINITPAKLQGDELRGRKSLANTRPGAGTFGSDVLYHKQEQFSQWPLVCH
jgi:hypothetical protein